MFLQFPQEKKKKKLAALEGPNGGEEIPENAIEMVHLNFFSSICLASLFLLLSELFFFSSQSILGKP